MKVIIAGAGLAGATAAVIFREMGHKVEIFETRSHVGGNCYDERIDNVTVHRYGPHGFHTSNVDVWKFLNRYTRFRETALEVVANTELGMIPVPFNNRSAEIVGDLSPEEIRDLIFKDYSEKHWGISWKDIPKSITSRLPERRNSHDCRYHLDRWQGVPLEGYTTMFESMLDGVKVHLGCHPDAWRKQRYDHLVFTGSIDEYFNQQFGMLEYRSLRFDYMRAAKRDFFQINECNTNNAWTRSVDHSHWMNDAVDETWVGFEYPCEWSPGTVRFYPKPFGTNPHLYRKYRKLAEYEKNVTFLGRLATYKYLDMDDAIAQVFVKLGMNKNTI